MRKSSYSRGFTLVEILVVIVIIGVVISIATLSLNLVGNDRDIRTEARRFIALSDLALDEAAMQGREFGIELMTEGYRFVEYDALVGTWTDVPADDTLRLRALPEDVEFELFLEGKQIVLENDPAPFDDPDSKANRTTYSPHLLIYSSGDATPFEVRLIRRTDNLQVLMRGDALGQVEILADEDL